MQKQCLVCGNAFDKKENESKRYWETKKYCSKACSLTKTAVKLQGVQPPKGLTPWNKGKRYSEDFKTKLDLTGLEKGRVFYKGKKRPEMTGANHPNWVEPIKVSCAYCNKELILKGWQTKNRNRLFCNRTCWALGTRGKGSPVFKGELATKRLRNRIMELPEYNEWRIKICIRDGHKCTECGSTKILEAHHLQPFSQLLKERTIKTTEQARMCKSLWDINGGITRCRVCHRKTDSYAKNLNNLV